MEESWARDTQEEERIVENPASGNWQILHSCRDQEMDLSPGKGPPAPDNTHQGPWARDKLEITSARGRGHIMIMSGPGICLSVTNVYEY